MVILGRPSIKICWTWLRISGLTTSQHGAGLTLILLHSVESEYRMDDFNKSQTQHPMRQKWGGLFWNSGVKYFAITIYKIKKLIVTGMH